MNIKPDLQELGLNKSEAGVYLYLLEHGLSFTKDIAEATDTSHTNVYNIVERLEDKKIIDEQQKDGKKAYLANSPKSIVRMIERKKEKAEDLIEDLEALYNKREGKPQIKFYDGWEQVQNLIEEHYEVEEAYSIGSIKQFWSLDREYFKERTKKLKENNVIWHDIMPRASMKDTGKEVMESLKSLYDITYIPEKFGSMAALLYAWENKIAIIHVEEPVFATAIINKNAAETLKTAINGLRDIVPDKYIVEGGKPSMDEKMDYGV